MNSGRCACAAGVVNRGGGCSACLSAGAAAQPFQGGEHSRHRPAGPDRAKVRTDLQAGLLAAYAPGRWKSANLSAKLKAP